MPPSSVLLQVSSELLQKYLDLEKNVILKFFLRFAGEEGSEPPLTCHDAVRLTTH